jgi:flavin-dependent dehydrogenase
MTIRSHCDVAVIGAGPAGSVVAAILARKGYRVTVLEKAIFPRFSIGESLLPQCMAFIEEAGLIDHVAAGGFQIKEGAAFCHKGEYSSFDFSEKFTPGWHSTYQVQRARFDAILADGAAETGAEIHYGHEIRSVDFDDDGVSLAYRSLDGDEGRLQARFCLDGSGFGQTLSAFLGLNVPTDSPIRRSFFTHVIDHIDNTQFERNKVLIIIHDRLPTVWLWLIPFADGTSSIGVVGDESVLGGSEDHRSVLTSMISGSERLSRLLGNAEFHRPVQTIAGYASRTKTVHGMHFALLGNAGGFIDPVFSSGVTIALKSASLAAAALDKSFRGIVVDWDSEFAEPLRIGVDTFRQFVNAWYDGRLRRIVFTAKRNPQIQRMICSILAGYAWDEANPFVAQSSRGLDALAALCAP